MNFESFEIDIETKNDKEIVEKLVVQTLKENFSPDEINSKGEFYENIDEHFEKISKGKEIICFEVNKTKDLKWKFCLRFDYLPKNEEKYGKYPDIKLSELFHEKFKWNCICSRHSFFKDIDDDDPYWGICLKNKTWYLADLGDSILLGPYTDGVNEFDGKQGIKISFKLAESGFKFEERIFELEKLKKEASR